MKNKKVMVVFENRNPVYTAHKKYNKKNFKIKNFF